MSISTTLYTQATHGYDLRTFGQCVTDVGSPLLLLFETQYLVGRTKMGGSNTWRSLSPCMTGRGPLGKLYVLEGRLHVKVQHWRPDQKKAEMTS